MFVMREFSGHAKIVTIRATKLALVVLGPRTFVPTVFYRIVFRIFIPGVGLIFR
jgi:hypothetical protein